MAPGHFSFLVQSVHNVLPTAANLVKIDKSDNALCPLCQEKQILKHLLSACEVALGQGRFTWAHNMVVKEFAAIVDVARLRTNKGAR